jgi:hypothetical protein
MVQSSSSSREPLLVGTMLCIASVVGLGLLLTMPQFEAWQKGQTNQTQLQTDVTQLKTQHSTLTAEIETLNKVSPSMPKHLVIRTSDPAHAKKHLKTMLDELIRGATQAGNQLVSLLPETASAEAAPPPPASTKADKDKPNGDGSQNNNTPINTADANTPAADANNADPNATAAAPVPPPVTLQAHPYELAFRGNFDQVLTLLTQLEHHRELVEITQVELRNEAGPQRQEGGNGAVNQSKPISLKLNLKLLLQPQL